MEKTSKKERESIQKSLKIAKRTFNLFEILNILVTRRGTSYLEHGCIGSDSGLAKDAQQAILQPALHLFAVARDVLLREGHVQLAQLCMVRCKGPKGDSEGGDRPKMG